MSPTTTYNIASTALTQTVDPVNNKIISNTIGLSLASNCSSYIVQVKEDKQPTDSTSGKSLPYITGNAGQASFITPGSTTVGFGYAMSGTGVPSGFAGGKYTSFNSIAETIMSGTATNGDSATMTVSTYDDYTVQAGSYSNTLTFTVSPTY